MNEKKYTSAKRENGAGSYTKLPSGLFRFQGTAKTPDGETLYQDNGRPYRLSGTGPTKAKAKREFDRKLTELLETGVGQQSAMLVQNVGNRQARIRQLARPVGELYQEWLDLYKDPRSKKIKPSTYDHYCAAGERLVRYFGQTSFGALDQDAMQRFFNWLGTPGARLDRKQKGLEPKTIRNTYVPIQAFMKYHCKKWGVVNPCEDVSLPAVIEKEMRVLTDEEMDIFIREIQAERLGAAMYVSLFTGLRMGELLALTWEDLDERNHRVKVTKNIIRVYTHLPYGPKTRLIVQEYPKSKKSIRSVRVPNEVFEILLRYRTLQRHIGMPNPDNLMFPTRHGTHTDPRAYQKRIKAVVQRCGEQGVGVHTLRHTFATRLAEQNVPLNILQKILGHASLVSTMRYSHALEDQKDQAVDTLDGRIASARRAGLDAV